MRALLTYSFIFLLICGFTGGVKMNKVKLREGITVKLPEEFYKMKDKDILERYRSYKLPIAMYSSPDRLTEFGVSISDNFWGGNDLELLLDFQKSNLLELFDEVKFEKQGVRKVHKHEMAFFQLESNTNFARSFEKKYSLLHYAVVDNRVLVFNFSCPVKEREKWEPIAWEIMDSIKLAKSIF